MNVFIWTHLLSLIRYKSFKSPKIDTPRNTHRLNFGRFFVAFQVCILHIISHFMQKREVCQQLANLSKILYLCGFRLFEIAVEKSLKCLAVSGLITKSAQKPLFQATFNRLHTLIHTKTVPVL